jgi:hypothetical protein
MATIKTMIWTDMSLRDDKKHRDSSLRSTTLPFGLSIGGGMVTKETEDGCVQHDIGGIRPPTCLFARVAKIIADSKGGMLGSEHPSTVVGGLGAAMLWVSFSLWAVDRLPCGRQTAE